MRVRREVDDLADVQALQLLQYAGPRGQAAVDEVDGRVVAHGRRDAPVLRRVGLAVEDGQAPAGLARGLEAIDVGGADEAEPPRDQDSWHF